MAQPAKKKSRSKQPEHVETLPPATFETLKAVRASGLLAPDFLRTYEELFKHPTGVTGAELNYILKTEKAHAQLIIFRQKQMCQRIERRRSNTPTGGWGWAEAATNVVPNKTIGWGAQERKGKGSNDHVGTRKLWTTIKQLITKHYEPPLKGLSAEAVEFVLRDIATDLSILQATIARRVSTAVSQLEAPKRHELEEACELLGVQPPKPGKPIDVGKARRNYHNMARVCHPDRSSSESTPKTEQFRRISDAFEVIKRWDTGKVST